MQYLNNTCMNELINICLELDNKGLYKQADDLFIKEASNKTLMKKKILIPSDVKEIATEAYSKKTGNVKFGTPSQIEVARKLKMRTYLDLEEVLDIFEYTVKNKNIHLKGKKTKSYLEWTLYGGDAGLKWSSDIVKLYLPKKWRNF